MQDDIKHEYLLHLERNNKGVQTITRTKSLFRDVQEEENKLGKDISQFNLLDIQQLYINKRWFNDTVFSRTYTLSQYTEWVINTQKLVTYNSYEFFDKVTLGKWIKYVKHTFCQYTTYAAIIGFVNQLPARERFIVLGLLEGISNTNGLEEFALARMEDIEGRIMHLYGYQDDEPFQKRTIRISEDLIRCAREASGGSGPIIKLTERNDQVEDNYKRQRQITYILTTISAKTNNELTSTEIREIGLFSYMTQVAHENEISVKVIPKRKKIIQIISDQYGLDQYKNPAEYLQKIINERQ